MSHPVRAEIKIKGSVFTGVLSPLKSKSDAEKIIENVRNEFHDATHHCYAYRINEDTFRYNDDGEPSGTAGRPILSMLDKHDLREAVLIVTRYFGGTKLGTGGLIRAYSNCAEVTIESAKITKKIRLKSLSAEYPFQCIGLVQRVVQNFSGRIKEDAKPEGMTAVIDVPVSQIDRIKDELITGSAGKIKFH